MRFLIVGFGRVGSRTALLCHIEGHDVVVVDADPDRADVARKRGFDAVAGDATNESVLVEAGLDGVDAVAALTGDPDVDFAACMYAKDRGARTVMRVGGDYVRERYEGYEMHVDEVVYPERLGAAAAKTALLGGDFNAVGELTENLLLLTVRVPAGAAVVGSRVRAVDFGPDARIYAHGAGNEPMTVPLPGATVGAGDRLALLASVDAVDEVRGRLVAPEVR